MLKYLSLVLLTVLFTGCAGSFTRIDDSEKIIQATTEIPGLDRTQVLTASRLWMEENFTALDQPITNVDTAAGTLTGSGQIAYPCSAISCVTKGDWIVTFALLVEARHGLVKTTFYDIQLSSPPSGSDPVGRGGMSSPVWSKRDMDAIRPQLQELKRDLVDYLLAGREK